LLPWCTFVQVGKSWQANLLRQEIGRYLRIRGHADRLAVGEPGEPRGVSRYLVGRRRSAEEKREHEQPEPLKSHHEGKGIRPTPTSRGDRALVAGRLRSHEHLL
jgi:hypothetical protein